MTDVHESQRCDCPRPLPSGRRHLGLEVCRLCRCFMVPAKNGAPTKRAEVLIGRRLLEAGAELFRRRPHLTNEQAYDELAARYVMGIRCVTWLARHASAARKLSGTQSVMGPRRFVA